MLPPVELARPVWGTDCIGECSIDNAELSKDKLDAPDAVPLLFDSGGIYDGHASSCGCIIKLSAGCRRTPYPNPTPSGSIVLEEAVHWQVRPSECTNLDSQGT